MLKRVLQPDPIGYSDGMNLYAYVGNDPLNFTDPTGQFKGDLRGEYYDLVSDELSEDDLRAEMERMMGNFIPGGVVTSRTAFAFRSFARQLFDKAKARVSRFINPVTRGLPRSDPIPRSLGAASRAEELAKKLKLNIDSPTTRQVLNSLDDTVDTFYCGL